MNSHLDRQPFAWRATALALLGFAVAITVMSYRASFYLVNPDHPDGVHWVMQDFRDVVYFPARAFLDGRNPYNTHEYMETYPVWHPLALYTPLMLIMHAPFAILPFKVAWQVYFVFSLLLLTILAALALRTFELDVNPARVLFIATLILLSRPGQMNLHLGQVGLQCAVGASLAVFYARRRPWLAATALALMTFKPSYGAPLSVLLLCRGDVLVVARAAALALVPTAFATIVLLFRSGSIDQLLASFEMTYHAFGTESFDDPRIGPFRIDVPALVARLFDISMARGGELFIGAFVLAIGAYAVYHCSKRESADSRRLVSSTLILLTTLACMYHQTYDTLVLAVPLVGLIATSTSPRTAPLALRFTLIALLSLIAINYLATVTALNGLSLHGRQRIVVTSINPGAVCAAMLIFVARALRRRGTPPADAQV